ncbi:MAG: Na+/H+ antiporter subunit [Devosia sp.]|nr:Na+/H+ antiporter subunit [Devosia sp.]
MSVAVIVLMLALLWGAITGNFSGLNLLLGAAIGALAVSLLRTALAPPRALRKIRQFLSLALLFFYELGVSAVRVAIVVLTPNLKSALRPMVVAFPLTVKSDAEITLLANMITLTPGTLSTDVSADRSILYVHVLNASSPEAVIAEIAGGFEAKVRELYA